MKTLQYVHFALLMFTTVIFFSLKLLFNDADRLFKITNALIYVVSGAYTVFAIVATVVCGNDDVKQSFIKKYKRALSSKKFLSVSTMLLTVTSVILLCQILGFQNVGFYSEENVELYSDEEGNLQFIGIVPAGKVTDFRLRTGKKFLLFKAPGGNYNILPPFELSFVQEGTEGAIVLKSSPKYEILSN